MPAAVFEVLKAPLGGIWRRGGSRLVEIGLWLAGMGAIVSVSLVVVAHLNDTYHIDHVAGAWLGLAKYASSGVVYPPLYDGTHFGGPVQGGAALLNSGVIFEKRFVPGFGIDDFNDASGFAVCCCYSRCEV